MYGSAIYWAIAFTAFFLIAFLFSVLINALFLRFAKTFGSRNQQNNVRWSATHKPSLGGISFYIVFLISTAALSFIFRNNDYFHNVQFLGIHAALTLGFLMGLFDDAYNTRVLIKLFSQITCGIILVATGTFIQITPYDWFNYLLTVIWVVGIMNAINMLDNMDGITAIVTFFILGVSLLLLFIKFDGYSPFMIIHIGMIAALMGFLVFNWNPSKMIMGDTGSQFLGVLLAAVGILFFWNQPVTAGQPDAFKGMMLAVMIFALPLSDTTTVVINRLRKGRSPFVGGRDHTTHHLSYLGISDRGVALIFLGISALNGAVVILASLTEPWLPWHKVVFGLWFLMIFIPLLIIGSRKKQNT